MNFKKTGLVMSLAVALGMSHQYAQAANLNSGDILAITPAVISQDANGNYTSVTTSWFGMDTNGNASIATGEKTPLCPGTQGIVVGLATAAGTYHSGQPAGFVSGQNPCTTITDTGPIVKSWSFYSSTGSNFLTTGITGGTAGLNLTGWRVAWNGLSSINMGTGAWGADLSGAAFANGVGYFSWNGTYNNAYTLEYTATVDDPGNLSGFNGVKYKLHLEGTVKEAPKVSSVLPTVGALTVDPGTTSLSVTFNRAMTVSSGFMAVSGGAASLGSCSGSGTATYTCAVSGLAGGVTYHVTLDSTKTADTIGANAQAAVGSFASYSFTTNTIADVTRPTISAISPANTTTGVATNAAIVVTFADNASAMSAATGDSISVSENGTPVAGTVTSDGTGMVFTFQPSAALKSGTQYTITVAGGSAANAAKDAPGNALAATSTTTFTTVPATSQTAGGATVSVGGGANVVSVSAVGTLGGTLPANTTFADGFVSYVINSVSGGQAVVTITFPNSIVGKTLYKVTTSPSVTYTALSETTPGCTFTRGGDGKSITMTIVDNGACDTDTTTPNTIADPIGPATVETFAGLPSSAGAGGGCAMNPASKFDFGMILALFGSLGYVGWRRARK